MIPVILSGGSGTRLWPLSRAKKPKQFLPLLNDKSMLQNTLLRLKGLPDLAAPMVICNEDHRFMVAEQLRELNAAQPTIMLEPVGRNTAPAIAVAALQAMTDGEDPLLLVLAADHVQHSGVDGPGATQHREPAGHGAESQRSAALRDCAGGVQWQRGPVAGEAADRR